MKIYLDETDAANPADRDAARRIIEEILSNDVFTKGSFVLEGYSAARRICEALTAARRDERRQGFTTPFRMRRTKPAPGAPAVMAKRPGIRPLYHWIWVDGIRFQSYRAGIHETPMFSDDGRVTLIEHEDSWTAEIDGVQVVACGLVRRFPTAEEAATAALERVKKYA